MHHEIRPSMWKTVYYDDWEIDWVIINMKGIRRSISIKDFYMDVPWNDYIIECWDASTCYRIIHAEKKWNLLEIELWDSILKHRR